MLRRLLLIMLIVPFVELFITSRVFASLKTSWDTGSALLFLLGSVLLAGIVGVRLIKVQGFRLLAQTQERLRQGSLPNDQLLEGILIIVAGLAFLIPGFLTDAVGLFLLMPGVKPPLARLIKSRLAHHLHNVHVHTQYSSHSSRNPGSRDARTLADHGEIIEAEIVKPR